MVSTAVGGDNTDAVEKLREIQAFTERLIPVLARTEEAVQTCGCGISGGGREKAGR
jgi:hypothetical protein